MSKQGKIGRKRRGDFDACAFSRLANNVKLGRESRGSLAHAAQSEPKQVAAFHKTAAVVFNSETDKANVIGKRNVQMAWFRMTNSIGNSFLPDRSEEHTSELQSLRHLVCRLL